MKKKFFLEIKQKGTAKNLRTKTTLKNIFHFGKIHSTASPVWDATLKLENFQEYLKLWKFSFRGSPSKVSFKNYVTRGILKFEFSVSSI